MAEEFAERMLRTMNEAAVALMVSVGHRTGLFDVMAGTAFPRSRFTGFDFSDDGLAAATAEAGRKALANVRFSPRDAARLGETGRFDFITTFDAVHDQARPDLVLAGIAQALRPGGVYLCVDISASSTLAENADHPHAPFLYTISCMHCMTVSLAQSGMGLGSMWGQQRAVQMLGDAGFTLIEAMHVDGDVIHTYYVCRREPGDPGPS